MKAVAWKPSAPETLHHALSGWFPEVREDGKGFSWNTALGGYGPGGEENLTPEDTGIYVPRRRFVHVPDALHDDRRRGDGRDAGRVLLPRRGPREGAASGAGGGLLA